MNPSDGGLQEEFETLRRASRSVNEDLTKFSADFVSNFLFQDRYTHKVATATVAIGLPAVTTVADHRRRRRKRERRLGGLTIGLPAVTTVADHSRRR
ncbi:hypothetical protein HanXRQr2_Chr05g0224461 [Helianthus annuus]|uniref:Uncharacterized protein n=1 Tax=Helianthus annuus TaxID=4232 RepID=A0A9K3J0T1_HELAN|nr:hypothetical protein HanXRQr2_Chr05g0224461 [Helianthus annuus]